MTMQGTIVKALSGFYYVNCGGEIITCRARGAFRHKGIAPLVGDVVDITMREEATGMVDAIVPRRNFFHRPAVANIDALVIIASAATPVTDPFLIDRLTAVAEDKDCLPIVCINKCDLDSANALFDIYAATGLPVLRVSAETGEGMAPLSALIAGKTVCFTGNSGVGKSSILNVLDPAISLRVGEVSEKLGRGRHTTRHIELFRLPNGAMVADTPGFSAFDTERGALPAQRLAAAFREFRPYLEDCQFVGCPHIKGRGCAVLAAVGTGAIPESRHASYTRLYDEAKQVKAWEM